MTLKDIGVNPFAMGYINFEESNYTKSKSVIDFCRWVDNKFIFKKTTWNEYNTSIKKLEYKQENTIFDLI